MMNTTKTHLELEIERVKAAQAEVIAKLKRAAAAEQRRVDERVVKLLREQQQDIYEYLAGVVRADITAANAQAKAKRARQVPADSGHGTQVAFDAGYSTAANAGEGVS